jgi:hypothetical protein
VVPHHALGMPFHPTPSGGSGTPSNMLQPPFTPGESLHGNPSTNFGSATGGFGTGFALGLGALGPSTPTAGLHFNLSDYINFTPTPGGGFSPVQRGSTSKAGSGSGSGLLAAPVGIGGQNIFASGGGHTSLEFGTPNGLGPGAAGGMSPKKSESPEKRRSKKTSLSSHAEKRSEATTSGTASKAAERLMESNVEGEISAPLKGSTRHTNNGDPNE